MPFLRSTFVLVLLVLLVLLLAPAASAEEPVVPRPVESARQDVRDLLPTPPPPASATTELARALRVLAASDPDVAARLARAFPARLDVQLSTPGGTQTDADLAGIELNNALVDLSTAAGLPLQSGYLAPALGAGAAAPPTWRIRASFTTRKGPNAILAGTRLRSCSLDSTISFDDGALPIATATTSTLLGTSLVDAVHDRGARKAAEAIYLALLMQVARTVLPG